MTEAKSLLRPLYEGQLNSIFHVTGGDAETFDLELVKINLTETPPGYEQFSLVFRAPHSMLPAQGLYKLQHDGMETEDLFLVPIESDEAGVYFEAVFNRTL